tara:strand:+ start:66 stop:758 length:693 start_codon:yes stop_codon:yes gene_type:complete
MTNHPTKILLLILLLFGCKQQKLIETSSFCKNIKTPCLDRKGKVSIKTKYGDIIIEIDGESAPITAGNFLDIIEKRLYEDTSFHRVIKSPYPFIIQGGNLNLKQKSSKWAPNESRTMINGMQTQNRQIPLEIKLKTDQRPRYNSPVINPNEVPLIELTHKRGAIAMARSQRINSGSTQFYIALKTLPELDGRYAVFGKVIKGMNIVELIKQGDKIEKTVSLINKQKVEKI